MRLSSSILLALSVQAWAQNDPAPCLPLDFDQIKGDAERLTILIKKRIEYEKTAGREGLRPRETECLELIKTRIKSVLSQPTEVGGPSYEFLMAVGQNFWLDKKFADAQNAFEGAIRKRPQNIEGLWTLAQFLEANRKNDEALNLLRKIVGLKPQDENEKQIRIRAGEKLFSQGRLSPQKRMKMVREWLAENPESEEAVRALADAALATQDMEGLIEARKLEKDEGRGWWIQAHLSFLQGRFAESLAIAEKFKGSASYKPGFEKSYLLLVSKNYLKLNQPSNAFRELLKMSSDLKEDSELAALFEQVVLMDRSLSPSDLQLATQFYPESKRLEVRALDGLMRDTPVELGDFDPILFRTASVYVERVLAADSSNINAHYWKAYINFQKQFFKDAAHGFLECLNLLEKNRSLHIEEGLDVGRIYTSAALNKLAQGYPQEAKEIVDRGLQAVRDHKYKSRLLKLKTRVEKQLL